MVVLGCITATVYLFGTGYLVFQAQAVEAGLVFSWVLEPQSATDAQPPILQMISLTLWGALSFWLLLKNSRRGSGILARTSLLSAALVLVIFAGSFLAGTTYPHTGLLESADSALLTWFRTGALSPATLIMAAVLAVCAFVLPPTQPAARPPVELDEAKPIRAAG